MTVRVLLVDDQALFRAGVRAMIIEPGIEIVGECADGAQAYRCARALAPDVVLMDLRMPGTDGVSATRWIVGDASLAAVRVVVLTSYDLDADVYAAIRAGASGYLLKDTDPGDLVRAVLAAARGDPILSPAVTRRLLAEFAARPGPGTPELDMRVLTAREREVFDLVVAGLSHDEVATRLVISPATAKTHVGRVLSKLGARDRAQLIVLAYESGTIRPGDRSRGTGTPSS